MGLILNAIITSLLKNSNKIENVGLFEKNGDLMCVGEFKVALKILSRDAREVNRQLSIGLLSHSQVARVPGTYVSVTWFPHEGILSARKIPIP